MSDESTIEDNEPIEANASEMLRTAREALGITQQQVADELYLTPAVIRFIDAGETEQITKQAFVRGYLRSYAKLVNLDNDLVVRQFERFQSSKPQSSEIRGVTREKVGSANFTGPVIRTGVIGLMGLLIIILLAWLLVPSSSDSQEVRVTSSGDTAPGTSAEADVIAPIVSSEGGIDSDQIAASLQDFAGQAEGEDSPVISLLETDPQDEPPLEPAADAVEEAVIRRSETPRSASIPGATYRVVNTATGNEILLDTGGSDALVLDFSDDCWVEIQDATGTSIYGDLNRNGDTLKVTGTAPFEVLFGKAPAVLMSFNGRAFDLVPHTTSVDTAKVRVGE